MESGFFSTTFNRSLGSVALAMVIATLATYAIVNVREAELIKEMATTVSVDGEGMVKITPDVAQFSFAVMAKGVNAEAAQASSSVKINAIIAFLKEQGVEEKDIQTENYMMYPVYQYDYSATACGPGEFCAPAKEIPDGFEVSQSVTVKVRDTAKAGALLAGVGQKEATGISGLSFVLDDEEPSKAEARAKAIADSQEKAQAIADQFGMKITRMMSYYESEGYPESPYGPEAYESDMMSAKVMNPELPMGEQEVRAHVSVMYEME